MAARIGNAKAASSKSSAKKPAAKSKSSSPKKGAGNRWVAGVKTVSTFPPEGLFTKSAAAIARSLASKKVSPKGPASGMRMLVYFINRGGHGLSASRRAELEKAKKLLSARIKEAQNSNEDKREPRKAA